MAQGATNYDQLFVAINNLYRYPGTSNIFDPARLLPFLLVIAFFYLLYRMSTRRLNASRNMLKPERIIEPEDAPSTGETKNLTAGSENDSNKNEQDS